MNWKQILAGLCGFAIGFWVCMPREATLQPRWEVLVLDQAGHGIPHAVVRETRIDNIDRTGQSTTLQTADSNGRAAFPAVRTRTSPLLRTIACARVRIANGAAPCGYSHHIVTETDGYLETARAESDLPLKSRGRLLTLTLRKAP